MFKKRDLVFVVGAYNSKDKSGNLEEYCKLELFAATEEYAIKRAREIVKKNFYEVVQVIEVQEKK